MSEYPVQMHQPHSDLGAKAPNFLATAGVDDLTFCVVYVMIRISYSRQQPAGGHSFSSPPKMMGAPNNTIVLIY